MKETYEQRDARRKTFDATIAPAVLAALNALEPGWTAIPRDGDDTYGGRVEFTRAAAGERLSLSYDSYRNRITASGVYGSKPNGGGMWMPRDHTYNTSDVSIGVNPDRAPAVIAKEIARRLLPTYREYLGWYREDCARARTYDATTRATFDQLVAASGGLLRAHQSNGRRDAGADLSAHLSDVAGVSYGSIRVSGDSVRFELSTNAACALRLAAALNGGQ